MKLYKAALKLCVLWKPVYKYRVWLTWSNTYLGENISAYKLTLFLVTDKPIGINKRQWHNDSNTLLNDYRKPH